MSLIAVGFHELDLPCCFVVQTNSDSQLPSKYQISFNLNPSKYRFLLVFLVHITNNLWCTSYRHNYVLLSMHYLQMYTLATNGAKCYITISTSGLNDSSVMDFICIFISLVVHVTAKIMSCSCSALNADSNDTKVDQN